MARPENLTSAAHEVVNNRLCGKGWDEVNVGVSSVYTATDQLASVLLIRQNNFQQRPLVTLLSGIIVDGVERLKTVLGVSDNSKLVRAMLDYGRLKPREISQKIHRPEAARYWDAEGKKRIKQCLQSWESTAGDADKQAAKQAIVMGLGGIAMTHGGICLYEDIWNQQGFQKATAGSKEDYVRQVVGPMFEIAATLRDVDTHAKRMLHGLG